MSDAPKSMLDHALAIAGRGWPVFPCHPENKQPLVEDGFKKASTDPASIRNWWGKHPDAMIGFPTGRRSGVFVIDLDPGVDDKTGEIFEVADLRKKLVTAVGEDLPHTLTVNTPGGGCHIYLRMPEGELRNRNPLMKRIDVRGEGGYVIAPPSARADGKTYDVILRAPLAGASDKLVAFVKTFKEKKAAEKAAADRHIPPARSDDERVDDARQKYAQAALNNQLREVERAPKGQRNSTLNAAAFSLGHLVGAGLLRQTLVRTLLEEAAEACGLVADDGRPAALKTIESGLAAGIAQPADLSKIGARARSRAGPARKSAAAGPAPPLEVEGSPSSHLGGSPGFVPPGGEGGDDEDLHRACAMLPRTDLGNAERFVRRHGRDFMWCTVMGWLAWDGRRWARENADGLVAKAVHATVRAIGKEAAAIKGTPDDFVIEEKRDGKEIWLSDKIKGWGLASQGAAHVACIARLAAPYLEIDTAHLDADPWKINVRNGTLHVARRDEGDYIQFRPHDRLDRITKLAPVDYDREAVCPLYDQMMLDVQPDETSRRSLHQYGGYALTGDISEQLLAFWWGKGKNGKSTVIDTWAYVAGEYSDTIPIESFLDQGRARRGGEATPDLATLPGVRMLRTSEPERGAKLAESLVKLMTGGEPMMVRHLNRDPFKFVPGFKAIISGNYKPEIHGTDEGIWRRVKLVPWSVTIPEEKRDRNLGKKLRAETSGILNRLLDGLRDYLDQGFVWGDEIDKATEAYRTDSDVIGRFLEACTLPSAGEMVQSSVLHKVFVAWARAVGEREWSAKGFGSAMRDRVRSKRSSVVWFIDIRLIRSSSDFVDEHGKPIERQEVPPADIQEEYSALND